MSSTAWVRLSDSAAIEMRPTSSVLQELAEPHRRIADEMIVGDPDVVEEQLAGVEAAPADAAHLRAHREAGACPSPRRSSRTSAPAPSADSVRASSVTPNDMSVPALEMNVLRPLISQPPSRRTARVRMPRASEPASGSVRPNAPSARPSASGRSQRSRCASVPKRYSGNEPIVTCACHAAATDWSARPICSIAATKPTVDMPMPPHSSGISMPSRPSAPISRSRSVGHRASSHASGRARRRSPSARTRGTGSTRSRSGSVSEKSTGRSYWTDRYNAW